MFCFLWEKKSVNRGDSTYISLQKQKKNVGWLFLVLALPANCLKKLKKFRSNVSSV